MTRACPAPKLVRHDAGRRCMAPISRNTFATVALAALLALAVLLAGCDGMGKAAEERITAAVPPGAEVLGDKAKLDALAKTLAFDAGKIDGEYQARLKVRALECAHGYEPGAFTGEAGVRDALAD